MLSSLTELEPHYRRTGEICYSSNGKRGEQIKPLFEDECGALWIGKHCLPKNYSRELFALEMTNLLCLPGINFPSTGRLVVDGIDWQISSYIHPSFEYAKGDSNFRTLTSAERQVGILYYLLANVDGNFGNLIKDRSNSLWVFDFEYSCDFESYWRLIERGSLKHIRLFMRPGPRRLEDFSEGILRVRALLESALSSETLFSIARNVGFREQSAVYLSSNVTLHARNIEKNLAVLVDAWNASLKK